MMRWIGATAALVMAFSLFGCDEGDGLPEVSEGIAEIRAERSLNAFFSALSDDDMDKACEYMTADGMVSFVENGTGQTAGARRIDERLCPLVLEELRPAEGYVAVGPIEAQDGTEEGDEIVATTTDDDTFRLTSEKVPKINEFPEVQP
jgi:hypothetical protein